MGEGTRRTRIGWPHTSKARATHDNHVDGGDGGGKGLTMNFAAN